MRKMIQLIPKANWTLEITFSDGAVRIFDAKPLLSCEAFQPLHDRALFMSARNGSYYVEWSNGADLSADTLYLEGKAP
jgi:hypothetical protein